MAKRKKIGLTTKVLAAAVISYVLVTVYNHDSATATNEYDPTTYFKDFDKEVEDKNLEGFKEIGFEEDLAQQFKFELRGTASYYADKFHGRMTANGEIFNMNEFSAAHKTLPFGTILKVTNLKNDQKTFVRINDRGPYVGDRIIDLSRKSASEIGELGLYYVKLEGFKQSPRRLRNNEKNYFYGYSYENDLVCVPNDALKLIDSTSNFGNAVRMYNLAVSQDKGVYLFADASEKNRMEIKNSNFKYYIGKIDPSVIIEDQLAKN